MLPMWRGTEQFRRSVQPEQPGVGSPSRHVIRQPTLAHGACCGGADFRDDTDGSSDNGGLACTAHSAEP